MKAITVRSISFLLGMVALAGAAYGQSDAPSPCASVSDDKSRLQCYDAQEAMKKGRFAPAAQASSATESSTASAQASAAPAPRAVAPAAAAPASGTAAPTTPASQAPVAQADSGDFGLTSEALRKKRAAAAPEGTPAEEERQVGRVKSVKGLRKGDYRIELENGQIWEETQRTGGDPPEVGETVTIRRASMGSYFLSRQAGLALRVKRVQ